jgi:DNA transposition AAA+ family ATPase
MKRIFAETSNVKKFLSTINKIRDGREDIPRMALIFSEPGLGKTKTAIWYATREAGAIYCRCINKISQRHLLEKIVAEAGEIPSYRTHHLFNQIVDQFIARPRILLIDEIDYLCPDGAIEILRDIHDYTNTPVVLIGMHLVDKKLMRYRHLYDRLSEAIVKFTPLTRQDIRSVIIQMCEVRLSDDAVDYLAEQTGGKFRSLISYMHRAEYISQIYGLKEITMKELKR